MFTGIIIVAASPQVLLLLYGWVTGLLKSEWKWYFRLSCLPVLSPVDQKHLDTDQRLVEDGWSTRGSIIYVPLIVIVFIAMVIFIFG